MPPCTLRYSKYAFEAAEISEYPGAAGPVSGWVLPSVIVVAVMPGAEAVFVPELLPPPVPQAASRPAKHAIAVARIDAVPSITLFLPTSLLAVASSPCLRVRRGRSEERRVG